MSSPASHSMGDIPPVTGQERVPVGSITTPSNSVVVLTPEQAGAAWIELRDADGKPLGFLARSETTRHFFTPQQIEEIQRRAQSPVPGKTFAEILESVRARIEG
ncbi:hypothetical protein NA78x_000951 [Anatilimnocola sp. NA78]|uniref:hypothetical protein n=1 Tax=Anatilimnocola sp. NA78 TaxID=3415683 RepID=UPI003CE4A5F2